MFPISARWIQEFEKHLYRRQHIILYSNIHDRFLWQGTYQDMAGFLNTLAIADLGDMLTADPERYLADEHHLLMLLKKCTLEGAVIYHLTGDGIQA